MSAKKSIEEVLISTIKQSTANEIFTVLTILVETEITKLHDEIIEALEFFLSKESNDRLRPACERARSEILSQKR